VVVASMVLAFARTGRPVVAADFAGDIPLALGLPPGAGPGLCDWLGAGPDVPADALTRISVATPQGITLIAQGRDDAGRDADADAGRRLAKALLTFQVGSPVIADCGRADTPAVAEFVANADRSLLVIRPCYLALARAVRAPRPTAVVVVRDRQRALSSRDIEDVLGVPVVTEVPWDAEVAKAVDAGLLMSGMPRRLINAVREVAA
jgi:hypothetical protein